MKSDKIFETVNHIIQTSYKDSPNTKIYQNYKIPNTSGRKREIDIFIETKINDFQIQIAIECKDYSSKVSVEKIEAFKGKCDRIPTINKKIFITKIGYQEDAKLAAKDFGIDLFLLKDIDEKEVKKWLLTEVPTPVYITRSLAGLGVQFHGDAPYFEPDVLFFTESCKEGIELYKFLHELVKRHFPALPIVFTREGEELSKDVFRITIECTENSFIEVEGQKHQVKRIWFNLEHDYEPIKSQIALNSFQNFGDVSDKAQSATVIAENGEIFSFVKKKEKGEIEIFIGRESNAEGKKEMNFSLMANMKIEKIEKENDSEQSAKRQ